MSRNNHIAKAKQCNQIWQTSPCPAVSVLQHHNLQNLDENYFFSKQNKLYNFCQKQIFAQKVFFCENEFKIIFVKNLFFGQKFIFVKYDVSQTLIFLSKKYFL